MYYEDYKKEGQQLQELKNKLKLSYLNEIDKQVAVLSSELLTRKLTNELYDYSVKKIVIPDGELQDLISDITIVKRNGLWKDKTEADVLEDIKKREDINHWLDNVATPHERAIFKVERDKEMDRLYKKFEK